MKTALITGLGRFLRATFNAMAPDRFYKPSFKAGDILVPAGIETGTPVDFPRFEGDTLLRVLGGFTVQIERINYGEYTSKGPQAEFRHTKLGTPYYEVKILEDGGAFSNYGTRVVPTYSKYHISAPIFDSRFELVPKTKLVTV